MPNLTNNRIDTRLTEADIASLTAHINAIIQILPEVGLTPAERKSMRGIQFEKRAFAQDCIMALKQNGSEIMPPYINIDTIITDFSLNQQLGSLEQMVKNILGRISDARRVSGNETLNALFTAYGHYEVASKSGIPGSKATYETLRKHFDKNTGRKSTKLNQKP